MHKRMHMSSTLILSAVIGSSLALGHGCKKDKNSGPGTGGGGGWLVVQDGALINVTPSTGQIAGYDFGSGTQLLDIARRGEDSAWVVGTAGTLLRTSDAGEDWEALELGTTRTLRSVAVSEEGPLYVAGDGGIALRSDDDGDTWKQLVGIDGDVTAVATDHDGGVALLVDTAGDVWRWDGTLARVDQLGIALNGVSLSPNGRIAFAAGDGGLLLRSVDGGVNWTAVSIDTDAALLDVTVSDGGSAFAVGNGGVLVQVDEAGATTRVLAPEGQALRSIYLSADGSGIVVGDDGVALMTRDRAVSWSPVGVAGVHTISHQ